VLVRTGQTVDILFDVTNPGLWMAHCHIAEHMQSGMDVQLQRRPNPVDLMSGCRETMPGRGGWVRGVDRAVGS
jgi:hypothetical protein